MKLRDPTRPVLDHSVQRPSSLRTEVGYQDRQKMTEVYVRSLATKILVDFTSPESGSEGPRLSKVRSLYN